MRRDSIPRDFSLIKKTAGGSVGANCFGPVVRRLILVVAANACRSGDPLRFLEERAAQNHENENTVCGIDRCGDRGDYRFAGVGGCGHEVVATIAYEQLTATVKAKLGRVFADDPRGRTFIPWKTVLANVAFGLKMRGVGKVERNRIGTEMLREVNLSDFAGAYPRNFPAGCSNA